MNLDFLIYVCLVALGVKFLLTLADKWGIMEWLQAHAPNKLLFQLFTCDFCKSFWLGLCLSIPLAVLLDWRFIFIPIFSCNLR